LILIASLLAAPRAAAWTSMGFDNVSLFASPGYCLGKNSASYITGVKVEFSEQEAKGTPFWPHRLGSWLFAQLFHTTAFEISHGAMDCGDSTDSKIQLRSGFNLYFGYQFPIDGERLWFVSFTGGSHDARVKYSSRNTSWNKRVPLTNFGVQAGLKHTLSDHVFASYGPTISYFDNLFSDTDLYPNWVIWIRAGLHYRF
jgi:hypothetical protein